MRSTQRTTCCQCAGCMNICDDELLHLAGADASCVDPWICLSHWSSGPQYCAMQQYCKASWLSSHHNITLLSRRLLSANTWAPQYSGNKEQRKTCATANVSFYLTEWTWWKMWILLSIVCAAQRNFSFYVTKWRTVVLLGVIRTGSTDRWQILCILTSTQM